MGTPSVLDSTKWQLHLQLGQSGLTRAKDARAMFEFGLKDATTAEVGGVNGANAVWRRTGSPTKRCASCSHRERVRMIASKWKCHTISCMNSSKRSN